VFFRAKSFEDASRVIESMMGFNGYIFPKSIDKALGTLTNPNLKPFLSNIRGDLSSGDTVGGGIICFIIVFVCPNSKELANKLGSRIAGAFFVGFLLAISILFISRRSEFLYFQF